jgi:enoyl-CoA hydratase/carnithine racemase
MSDVVLTRKEGTVFEVILNRPDKRNAMNDEMMEALSGAFDEAEREFHNGVRVVVVRAEGRAFSSGIDVEQLVSLGQNFGDDWRDNLFPFTAKYQAIFNKIERCSMPVICVVHGYCLGLGFELALACDFRIGVERTRLGLPETRLGVIPDVGGSVRLVKLVGPSRAKDIIMTGRNLDMDQALDWGIVNYVVAKAKLDEKLAEFVAELCASSPLAVSYAKRVVNDITDNARGLQVEAWAQAYLFRTDDFMNAVEAIINKTYPIDWEGK